MARRVLLLVALLLGCEDPMPPPLAGVAAEGVVVAATFDPSPNAKVMRIALALSSPISPDAVRAGRVLVVEGGADAADVAALARNRATSALRAREVPLVAWGEPVDAPRSIFVQPSRRLARGRSTLIVLLERRPPWVLDLAIEDDEREIARRVWSASPFTFCAATLPRDLAREVTLAPGGERADVRLRADVPCFDVVPRAPFTGVRVLPPAISDTFVDPSPIAIESPAAVDEPPCPETASSVDGLCLRVDDDRVTLFGGVVSSRLALGRISGKPVVAELPPSARFVVRGLAPASSFEIDLAVREGRGERRIRRVLRTRPKRRHVVVNEVLARPPSGAATQRFVELVNDGDDDVDLDGLLVVDGGDEIELPKAHLAPGAFALLVPDAYVDGLAGEVPPPRGVLKLFVDALRLSSEVSVVEPDGRVLSRFPGTTSTRTVARGRRTPQHPDDAPDAFGWDANNKATPGRANQLAP